MTPPLTIQIWLPYPIDDMQLGEADLLFQSLGQDIKPYILRAIAMHRTSSLSTIASVVATDIHNLVDAKLARMEDTDSGYVNFEHMLNHWPDGAHVAIRALSFHLNCTWRNTLDHQISSELIAASSMRSEFRGETIVYTLLVPTS